MGKKVRSKRYIPVEHGWQCVICKGVIAKKYTILNHSDTCFEVSEEGFKCGSCKELFPTTDLLKEHLSNHQNCASATPPTLICELCTTPHVYYNERKYQAHILRQRRIFKCE